MASLKRVREESVNDLGTLLMIKENQGQKAYDMEENENVLRGGARYLYIHILVALKASLACTQRWFL